MHFVRGAQLLNGKRPELISGVLYLISEFMNCLILVNISCKNEEQSVCWVIEPHMPCTMRVVLSFLIDRHQSVLLAPCELGVWCGFPLDGPRIFW